LTLADLRPPTQFSPIKNDISAPKLTTNRPLNTLGIPSTSSKGSNQQTTTTFRPLTLNQLNTPINYSPTLQIEGSEEVYFQSISAMSSNRTKNFEELRFEDYKLERKGIFWK